MKRRNYSRWIAGVAIAIGVGGVGYLVAVRAFRDEWFEYPVARRSELASQAWCVSCGVVIGGSALWGMLAPASTAVTSRDFGVAVTGILVLVLLLSSARTLVHAPYALLLGLVALGVAITLPLAHAHGEIANVGRVLIAIGAGCAIARALERWTWSVGLVIAAACLDAWSVFATHGITRNLGSASSSVGNHHSKITLENLLYVGPKISGSTSFGLGLSDLVVVMACIATAHFWRLGERTVTVAVALGIVSANIWSLESGTLVPALPMIGGAYLAAVALGVTQKRRLA